MLTLSLQPYSLSNKGGGLLLRSVITTVVSSVVLGVVLWMISWSFGLVGGIKEFGSAIRFELPYLLLTYAALLYLMRPTFWRILFAALPIIALYLVIDLHYVYMHSIFKLDELLLLPEGLNVSPVWVRIGAGLTFCVWLLVFIKNLKRRLRELMVPLLLLALAAVMPVTAYCMPKEFLKAARSLGFSIIPWSDRFTSAVMGRTTALFLFAATKREALDDLAQHPVIDDPDRNPALLVNTLYDFRNIHILVLESFLDPQRFSGLDFRTSPDPPQFDALRKNLHISKSPVFGGGTAQVEFEILCGVPALELYSPAEFSMFTGASSPCLPNLLDSAGYRTIATQSYKPEFFNSEKAYQTMGFQEINFPSAYTDKHKTYLKYDIPNSYIFDGDLLSQNLFYVKKLLADGKPFLNYVLGIYGHLPHVTDTDRFPPKVDVQGVKPGSQAYLAIQQHYYRAEAVAEYINRLREMDPKSLILVTSDHLPPLDAGPLTYQTLGYSLKDGGEFKQNIWFYFGPESKNIALPDKDYEFMDFLLDNLTENRICREMVCKNHHDVNLVELTTSYNHIIALGSGLASNASVR
ncbi:LTA synthase family protein [Desulfopila aestuarii]|uniref:Phosphoglycerol transferase MdoB n=1 Tax=Desulfopila aestuarii DSM 18488 TaxID=1121416 RepID=A0A1M7YJE9_9BACT|nr:LTA synthase family protein [Desulfopila aestuarii]SHO52745.1 Phosphoglycerol transferase MdoB [Desulfopila aestuarii DSM 18488]